MCLKEMEQVWNREMKSGAKALPSFTKKMMIRKVCVCMCVLGVHTL